MIIPKGGGRGKIKGGGHSNFFVADPIHKYSIGIKIIWGKWSNPSNPSTTSKKSYPLPSLLIKWLQKSRTNNRTAEENRKRNPVNLFEKIIIIIYNKKEGPFMSFFTLHYSSRRIVNSIKY